MSTSININDILSQVKKLDTKEQQQLLRQILLLLKETEVPEDSTFRLTSLAGLGSEVWQNTNIDAYIEGERQW